MNKSAWSDKQRKFIFLFMAAIFLGLIFTVYYDQFVYADNVLKLSGYSSDPWAILKSDGDKIVNVPILFSLSYLLRIWAVWACIVSIVWYLVRVAFPTKPSDIDEAKTGIFHKLIIVICVSGLATLLNVIKLLLDSSVGY